MHPPRLFFLSCLRFVSFRFVPSSDPDFHEWAVIDGLDLRANGSATNGQCSAGLKLLIGGLLGRLCEDRGVPFAFGSDRLKNRAQLEADIAAAAALTHVFNAAGVTGCPNVDWCEDQRVDVETISANVVGTLTLGDVCSSTAPPVASSNTTALTPSAPARASRRRTRPTSSGPSAPRLRPWLKNC